LACCRFRRAGDCRLNRLRRYELVIFDCDGVLVDSELLSCNALVDCLRRHGVEVDLRTAMDRFLGRSTGAIRDYCTAAGKPLPEAFFTELRIAVKAAFTTALEAVPGCADVLRSLKVPFCVASSSDPDRIDHSLHLAGLSSLVAGRIFSAAMVANGKPAPDLFLHAAACMGTAPASTLVVEDSESGVEAARAAGMTVWGFVGGSHYRGRDGRRLLAAAGAERVFERMVDFYEGEGRRADGAHR
jgi:HAD superfamily hydrolase (TIGR01509 family)